MGNTGHGHVFPREDGVKARCGGPGICSECNAVLAYKLKADRLIANHTHSLDDHRPHINAKALCLNMVYKHNATMPCFKQWIATCPAETPLTKLECPECHAQNSFAVEIKTKPLIGEDHED